MSEKSCKCLYCPCDFASEHDLELHLKKFGRRDHNEDFKRLHAAVERHGLRDDEWRD